MEHINHLRQIMVDVTVRAYIDDILRFYTCKKLLQALIEEQYFRLDMRRKTFMDAIRLSSRKIFYCLMDIFRPLYNNYRDDHVILRELTRSLGIIERRDGVVNIQLMPTMEFQPKVKQIVTDFLKQMSYRINTYLDGRYLPVRIHLLGDQSELFGKRQKE